MKRTGYSADAKAYADAHGYFWLPCPRCGEYFGGHEWDTKTSDSVQCLRSSHTTHGTCCRKKSDEEETHACRRAHERVGE